MTQVRERRGMVAKALLSERAEYETRVPPRILAGLAPFQPTNTVDRPRLKASSETVSMKEPLPGWPVEIGQTHSPNVPLDDTNPGWWVGLGGVEPLREGLSQSDTASGLGASPINPYTPPRSNPVILLEFEGMTRALFEGLDPGQVQDDFLILPGYRFLGGNSPASGIVEELESDITGSVPLGIAVGTWPRSAGLPELAEERHPKILMSRKVSSTVRLLALDHRGVADQIVRAKPAVDPLDIEVQLDTLRSLEMGWADGLQPAQSWGAGYGTVLNQEGLNWLASQFDRFYAASLPRPYLYPTPEGGVQAEWLREPHDASLEIDLELHSAEWHCLNLETKDSVIKLLNLEEAASWAWLSAQVLSLG